MPEKILVVDDQIVNRRLLIDILKKKGYELIEAEDGEEAIELTLREQPDLVLLDIVMPKKDGYEVCFELQQDSRSADIPVIFVSSKSGVSDKIKGIELGGVDYVTKPFDGGEVLARVNTQLKIRNLTKRLKQANNELLEKQRLIDEDLKAGAEIQRSLLSLSPPEVEDIDVVWRFMPCQKVGGDVFNVFQLDEDHWAIYMLDVSGHGIPSAMVAVSVSQMLQPREGFFLKRSIKTPPYYEIVSPSRVLDVMDQKYHIESLNKFFTISYLILNVKKGTIRYSSAGHPPPVLFHRDGSMELLKEGGTIIGMGGMLPFEEGEKKLSFGDRLFIYTDGIVEYQNEKGEFYGEDRFFEELQRQKEKLISNTVDGVITSLMRFGNNTEPQDDISLLALEFRGNNGSPSSNSGRIE